MEGEVASQDAERVVIEVSGHEQGGGPAMTFKLGDVHTITVGNKHHVINEKPHHADHTPHTAPQSRRHAEARHRKGQGHARGHHGVPHPPASEETIRTVGSTPPDWWDSVPLQYPNTLDLTWPDRPQGPWNAGKNVGRSRWSVIDENPGKWRSGVRFLHYMLTVHKDDPQKLTKVMNSLASCYFNLLQDWPRAAFWWRMAARANR